MARAYDILLIVADTYRKDNAERGLANAGDSPFFRRLRPFDWFPRCFSSAPWTLPACSSILTGLHSSTHGYFMHRHPLEMPTIGRHLRDDFRCVAIVNNGNLRTFTGFQDDFDEYHYLTGHDAPFDKARSVLAGRDPARPLFLFFHTNIPHDYYLSSSQKYFERSFPERSDWFFLASRVTTWRGVPAADRGNIRPIYDASTRNMEERLAALLDSVDLDRTIVAFVADHGEGFEYDRARVHHGGRLHDDLVRVPLLIRLPEGYDPETRARLAAARDLGCSSSDVTPTLLQLAGRPVPPGLDGRSLAAPSADPGGRRLVTEDRRYLYKPNRERLNVNFGGKNTTRWMRMKNAVTQRVLLRGFNIKGYVRYPNKLIVTSLAQAPGPAPPPLAAPLLERLFLSRDQVLRADDLLLSLEMFDLERDPGERRNLLAGLRRAELREAIGDRVGSPAELEISVGGRRVPVEDGYRVLTPIRHRPLRRTRSGPGSRPAAECRSPRRAGRAGRRDRGELLRPAALRGRRREGTASEPPRFTSVRRPSVRRWSEAGRREAQVHRELSAVMDQVVHQDAARTSARGGRWKNTEPSGFSTRKSPASSASVMPRDRLARGGDVLVEARRRGRRRSAWTAPSRCRP